MLVSSPCWNTTGSRPSSRRCTSAATTWPSTGTSIRLTPGCYLLKVLELRDVALPEEKLWGHGEIPELGKPAANVLDVLVDTEDLLDHEHGGKRSAQGWLRAVGRDLTIGGRDLHFASEKACGVRRDRLGRHWLHGQGKARSKECDSFSAGQLGSRHREGSSSRRL